MNIVYPSDKSFIMDISICFTGFFAVASISPFLNYRTYIISFDLGAEGNQCARECLMISLCPHSDSNSRRLVYIKFEVSLAAAEIH